MVFSKTAKSFLLVAAVALLVALPAAHSRAAPAPRIVGACNPSKVKFSLSARDTETTSASPVNIADTATTFTQARTGCVIVDFTATDGLTDPPPGAMFIDAMLVHSGGAEVPGRPSSATLNFAASGFENRAIQFVFPDVTPGNYVLRMRVSSSNGGGVLVSSPNTVVHYN
jgi:hypothetical protein